MNVLIVDDEPDIRNFLASEVQERGHKAFMAANGEEALVLLDEQEIDFIISDMRMPRMSGVELLKQVKIRFPMVQKFILITGFAQMDEKQAQELGATGLIFKPLNIELIRSHLA